LASVTHRSTGSDASRPGRAACVFPLPTQVGGDTGLGSRIDCLLANMQTSQAARIIRVAIIEDQRRIREGLDALICGTDGYQCSGSFRSIEHALAQPWAVIPDVALIDVGLPGVSGIEGIRLLKQKYPSTVPVMLTIYEDDERIFDALCAGACGYLLKKTPPAKLLEYLKDAMSGGSPMSPEVARRVIRLFRAIRPPEQADYNLTPHESRLLKLLVEGHNYTTAAGEMGVTFNTIAFHMRNIYQKLQVHSKSEAVAKALQSNNLRSKLLD
jgi:DNA-binding NarL/FixJ family response regulator